MGIFFVYVLKSGVCLSLFYLFYRLLLSKETFHRFNRVALLGILVLSLLLPLIEVTTTRQTEMSQTVLTIEQLLLMAENQQIEPAIEVVEGQVNTLTDSIPWVGIILILYIVGALFFICKNVYSLFRLFRLMKTAQKKRLDRHIILLVHEQEVAPFSWMKYIVVSRKDLEENGREILIHECAHIRKRHSIDLLIADVCIFFQWFNPGAWLLKQELQNIHEYEADETVINEGVNAKEYQLLLIKKAVGTRLYSMANSFNHSKIKKRITMMLKEKSSPWARLKYFYVLPLAAIAVTAFARPEISEKTEEISAVKVNDLVNLVQENLPQDTVKASKSSQKSSVKVVGTSKSIQVQVKEEEEPMVIFEVVEQMPEYPGGMDALRKYLRDKVSTSKMKGKVGGKVTVSFTVSEKGKVKEVKALETENSDLSEEAERIVREMPDWTPGKQRGKPVSVKYSVPVRFGSIRYPENKKPMMLVNGEEFDAADMDWLNPEDIESFSILKDSASITIYGDKGKNGVVLITTNKSDKNKGGASLAGCVKKENDVTTAVPDYLVTGTVVDEQGHPQAGVSIIIPGTVNGTLTDKDGHFKIKAIKGGTLHFSFVGCKTVKVNVTSPTINVKMEQEVIPLLEVPSTIEKVKVSTSLAKEMENSNFFIQKSGAAQPLVIVDGKEIMKDNALSKIPVERVKSFTILKDDTALKAYGDKGKNGVIIVTLHTEEELQARKNHP